MVGVSGGVRGCGFFCCVAYGGGLLVEWGTDCAGVGRFCLPAHGSFLG